jgi:hypothetical protein
MIDLVFIGYCAATDRRLVVFREWCSAVRSREGVDPGAERLEDNVLSDLSTEVILIPDEVYT